jgi:hypothetical protein
MCTECDYCGIPACSTAELRMAADPHRGGAVYPCCHDCFCDGHSCSDCDWFELQTIDEFVDEASALRDAMMADRADAMRDLRAGQ